MDSSENLTHHHHKPPLLQQFDTAGKHPSSRRTPSFSSSSSLSPYNSSSSFESLYFAADDHPSPCSPLRFSGVPFSWEQLPGIPKKQTSLKKKLQESSMKLLPLPPPSNTAPTIATSYNYKKKNFLQSVFQRDPFFAAMVECSKDDDDDDHEENEEITRRSNSAFWNINIRRGGSNNNKVSRSVSDRFGFINLYSSCKNASAISESIIYLPTSRRSRRNYQHFNRRSL